MFQALEATTDEQKLKAYRLRYEVFFREGHDGRYADHESQTYTDRDDGPHSRLVVCLDDGGEVIGTVRLTCLRDWPFIAHELYDFRLLASILQMPESDLRMCVARVDRGVVSRHHRGSKAFPEMMELCARIAREIRSPILVSVPGVDNLAARQANKKLGWTEYPVVATHNGFTGQLIYKDCRRSADDSS